MGSNKVRMNKCILMMVVMCMAFMAPKMVAFAGGINGNEARVIAAASGTFTYEGKTYRAGASYINSLTSYLSGDDVDLTAAQADEAISMMYASIAEGVAQGYLYPVGEGATTEEGSTEEEPDGEWASSDDEEEDEEDSKKKDKDDKKEDATDAERKQQTENELNVWDAMSNPTENKKKLEARPEKKDASAAVELEPDAIVVTTKDQETISISKDKPIVSDSVVVVLTVIGGILLGVTVVCGIILFAKKCMSFKKAKGRKARPGHSKRRKIRRHTRGILTITTTIAMTGILILLGLYVSLFNYDAIMQNMQSSGYFRYAYSQYIAEQANAIAKQATDEGTVEEVPEIQTYDEYLFTIKQNSLKVLEGNMEVIIPDSNVAPYIYNLKTSFVEIFAKSGISLILTAVFGILLMVFMDQRRERGVKHTAVAILIASGVMAVLTVVMLVYKPYTFLYIEPDYLYLFLMECIKRCVTALTSITAFCVVLGMLIVGIYKTMCSK
ncbi:MAG: hypothetical protein E7264_05985 [Lachnospiraceae bacterium]|nr:hypothetical protein [Lachnospiraceae bacterium]